MKYQLTTLLILLLIISCTGKNKNKEENKPQPTVSAEWMPSSDPVKFWDGFYFGDTVQTGGKQMVQWMNEYVHLLYNNQEKVSASLAHSLDIAAKDSIGYATFTNILKTYIYDPNSPYRNDEWYIYVLEHVKSSDKAGTGEKGRAEFELGMLYKNRIGEKATNFSYTLASGKTDELYRLSAENILLFFYNPDCEACKENIARMKVSAVLSKAISSNIVKILAIYTDKDITLWDSHIKEMPSSWINSYDKHQVITNKKLYDLKAIPTLYLLDKDKKVELKDVDFPVVEKYLFEKYPLVMQ